VEYIKAKEAADILGFSVRQLSTEVRRGMLKQHFPSGRRTPYYDAEEVSELAELRKKKISLPEVAAMAQRAHMQSLRQEKLTRQLMTAIGADIPNLPLDREYIVSLWYKLLDDLQAPRRHTLREVLEWSGIFSSLGEEHLQAIETFVGIEEPWKPFAELSMRLYAESPTNLRNDPASDSVYRLLNVARDKLRHTMKIYMALKKGTVLANKMFPKAGEDVHNDILALVIEKRRKRDKARRKS
jgi:hypothetical protein